MTGENMKLFQIKVLLDEDEIALAQEIADEREFDLDTAVHWIFWYGFMALKQEVQNGELFCGIEQD